MSDFYPSLENDPKGGPLDIFFHFHCIKSYNFASFCLLITSSPLARIIQHHEIYIFVYTDILGPIHILRHSYKHSAQAQLVVLVFIVFLIVVVDVVLVFSLSSLLSLQCYQTNQTVTNLILT